MSKRDEFYDSLVYEGYKLILPADETERKEMGRALLGARLVACADVLVDGAEKIVNSHVEFTDFTAEQKEKVLALISNTTYGMLYWQCVKMDNFYGVGLEMFVAEYTGEGKTERTTQIVGPGEEELHHSYFDWAEQFGDNYDEDSDTRFSLGLTAEPPKD